MHLVCGFLLGVALTAVLFGLSPQAASRLSAPLGVRRQPHAAPIHRRPNAKRTKASGQPLPQPPPGRVPAAEAGAEPGRPPPGKAAGAAERALPENAWRDVVAERLAPWAATGVTREMLDAASRKHYMSGR